MLLLMEDITPNHSPDHSPDLPLDRAAIAGYNKRPHANWSQDRMALKRSILRWTGKARTIAGTARASGLGQSTVRACLEGRQRPYLMTGLKLAKALGMPPLVLAIALDQARKNHLRIRKEERARGIPDKHKVR
jgi:hypothetical protein